mgnify:FL=1
MNNLSIKYRIMLVAVVAMLGMIATSVMLLLDKNEIATEMAHLNELGILAPVFSGVVHEMQKERGMSAAYIGSSGKTFANELPQQRSLTDSKRTALTEALGKLDTPSFGGTLTAKISAANTALGQFDTARQGVSGLTSSVGQMAGYYTGTIAKLLSVVEEMANLSSDANVTRAIAAYTNFLQGKERAGIERAMGANGFGKGEFASAVYIKFTKLIGQQEILFSNFKQYGTAPQADFFKTTITGPSVVEVARMRKVALASKETGTLDNIAGKHWFGEITKKINLMKTVEDRISNDLLALTSGIQGAASSSLMWLAGIVAVLVIGISALAWYIITGITGPVQSMTQVMAELAQGNNDVEVLAQDQGDEIGEMARAVQVFKDNAIEKIRLEEEEMRAADTRKKQEEAERQRESEENAAREASQKRMTELTDGFGNTVEEVLETVSAQSTQMEGSARSMTEIAKRTESESVTVASAAEEATASVQTVASAAEELSSSISEISRQVVHSSDISANAVSAAENTSQTMNALAEGADKIGEVVELINDIAEQTNLLALNATIEAARAGDAGKGFAVVASEVKNLASQTSKATEDIGSQISNIQSTTQEAVAAIEAISATITEMNEIATNISAAVEEQGAATSEISRSVQEAASGTQEVAQSIVKVKAGSEETGGAAGEVLTASRDLAERFNTLRSEVEEFLTNVKAV